MIGGSKRDRRGWIGALAVASVLVIGQAGAADDDDDGPSMAPAEAPAKPAKSDKPAAAKKAKSDDDEPALAPPEEDASSTGLKAKLHELGLSGSLRAAYWSSNRRGDDDRNIGVAQAWGKFDKKLGHGLGVFVEGYGVLEDVFDRRIQTRRFREAYLDYRYDAWDLRVGKQIIAWGRTDRLNPTDNLTPRDFTLLDPEFDEDRYGSLAFRGSYNWGRGKSVTAVWIPKFSPNTYAFRDNAHIKWRERKPGSPSQFGLKYDVNSGGIDWSVSYYDGFDLAPDMRLTQVIGSTRYVDLIHHRIRVFGGDAATTIGANRYAAEVAYTRTEDPDGKDPSIKNPFFYGVVGVEHDFTNNLTGIVQVFYRHVFDFVPATRIANADLRAVTISNYVMGTQYDKDLYGLSARIGKKWLNETLEGEFAGSLLLNRPGYFLRTKVTYIWSDELKLIGGFEYFSGADTTSYGVNEKNRAVFAEVRYFF